MPPPASIRRVLLVCLALAAVTLLVLKLHGTHFDWHGFAEAWRAADWRLLLLGVASIFAGHVLRALRWAVFLRPALRPVVLRPTALSSTALRPAAPQPDWSSREGTAAATREAIHGATCRTIRWTALIGPQFIGFAALAVFGRLGELVRPLLIARRTGLSASSQIAVVAVERIFDLGAFALIFSLNLMLSPSLYSLPYHERFRQVGLLIAALTVVLIGFVAAIRLAGAAVARILARLVAAFHPQAALVTEGLPQANPARPQADPGLATHGIAAKVLEFRDGLAVVQGPGSFALLSVLSLLIWGTIALAYILTVRAFPPPAGHLTPADSLVLLGFSVVGSLVQLPAVGGGAQVGTISALTLLFGIPQALAVSAALMLYAVTTLAVIPPGLLFARLEGISLRSALHQSEQDGASAL